MNLGTDKLASSFASLKSGPLGRFWDWWTSELKAMLPERWRSQMLAARKSALFVRLPGAVELNINHGLEVEPTQSFADDGDVEIQREQIKDLLNQHELADGSRVLVLDSNKVLQKTVHMPAAVEGNLHQALGYEMDRQTPFSAADVYYDYQILERDKDSLKLQLFVLPREELEAEVEQLAQRGIKLTGVDIGNERDLHGLNLLPREARGKVINRKARIVALMAMVTLGIMIGVLYGSVYVREQRLQRLQEVVTEAKTEARAVQKLTDRIADAQDAADFFYNKRESIAARIEVLADLTQVVPADTYLERLTIREGEAQLQGQSGTAQALIGMINGSPRFDQASFTGSITQDPRTGLDKFRLDVNVVPVPTEAPAEAPAAAELDIGADTDQTAEESS